MAIGSKQHACMSTTQLAIWPCSWDCHDLKTWTHSHHNIYKYIVCACTVDRARLSVVSTSQCGQMLNIMTSID